MALSVPRSHRWAAWLSSRRCQIIDSPTRGERNGNARIVSAQTAMRSVATRRGTTASVLEPMRMDTTECSGTIA